MVIDLEHPMRAAFTYSCKPCFYDANGSLPGIWHRSARLAFQGESCSRPTRYITTITLMNYLNSPVRESQQPLEQLLHLVVPAAIETNSSGRPRMLQYLFYGTYNKFPEQTGLTFPLIKRENADLIVCWKRTCFESRTCGNGPSRSVDLDRFYAPARYVHVRPRR